MLLDAAPLQVPLATLAAQARLAVDSVLAEPSGWRYWVDVFADISLIVIALALIIAAVALLVAVWGARKLYQRVDALADRVRVDPVVKHTRDIAENINYMSSSVRADVEQLNRMVASANERLTKAADTAEHRIHELNALLGVVQEEAENLFIDTASTIRGVQVGTDRYAELVANGRADAAERSRRGNSDPETQPTET